MLAYAIVGHLVGDYLLQNDYAAANKKKSSVVCIVHCLLWTLSVAAFTGWWSPPVLLILFATHFAQDRTNFIRWWMGKIGQHHFAQPPMAPWSIIVVDNTFHLVALALIARFLV